MFKVSVMVPNRPGTRCDMNYTVQHHMKMAQEPMGPEGLIRIAVDQGVPHGGQPAPYPCVGQLHFEDLGGYDQAIQKHGQALPGDFPNYTGDAPIRLFSEVVI